MGLWEINDLHIHELRSLSPWKQLSSSVQITGDTSLIDFVKIQYTPVVNESVVDEPFNIIRQASNYLPNSAGEKRWRDTFSLLPLSHIITTTNILSLVTHLNKKYITNNLLKFIVPHKV